MICAKANRTWAISSLVKLLLVAPLLLPSFQQTVCTADEGEKPSRTAEVCALYRAIGAMERDESIRSNDTLAAQLLGKGFWERSPYSLDYDSSIRIINKYRLGTYYYVNVRTKHMDALLRQAVARGVKQVVILGAGYDSRAYRFQEFPGDVRFFEVDLPRTQKVKEARIKEIFGSVPSRVVYTPIDFNTQTFEEALVSKGYDPSKRAFFIWEGVTMYLNASGVESTLKFIVNKSAPGSSVVFDYVHRSVVDGTTPEIGCKRVADRVAKAGEPWLFGIKAGEVGGFLRDRGFVLLEDLGPEALTRLYLSGVQKRLP